MNNSIRIRSNKNNLKVVRDFVTHFLSPYTLADRELNQIILAVDEITANLIIHANKEDENKFVKLAIFQTGDTFLFELSDNGHSFKPEKYREPDIREIIKEGGKGGMGIALVKRIMDKVEFTTQGNSNICRLYKKVNQLA
jgi:serine/threonine-protein kinase RsbW